MEEAGDKRTIKIDKVEDYFNFHSRQASIVIRNLVLIGFGLVWFFKDILGPSYPLIIILLAFSILCDTIQYLITASRWDNILVAAEKNNKKEVEIETPKINFNKLLFWSKVILAFVSYILIAINLFSYWSILQNEA